MCLQIRQSRFFESGLYVDSETLVEKARVFFSGREDSMNILISLGLVVLGFALLVKGADFFVDGASGIASRFGIPQLVIGLTIVAMGTSLPEAAVSITAAFKGSAGITIGNIVGSNILNVSIILGLASVIIPIAVQKSTVKYEMPFMMAVTLLLVLLGMDGKISRLDGAILWACFLLYLYYIYRMTKNGKEEQAADALPLAKSILFVLFGAVGVVLGSDFAVDGASELARIFGMSERFIGLTIVALGTSLPELVTSVSAARKGNADIAIGNIVGSNLFNILFVVGTSSLIIPVPFNPRFIVDGLMALVVGLVLWLCVRKNYQLTRKHGIILLILYVFYFLYLCTF